jgi:hypothetical protein
MGEGRESYSHVYVTCMLLEVEDDERSIRWRGLVGWFGLVGPGWCGPILFSVFFITFDIELQINSNKFLNFCKIVPCTYRHMGLVFIKNKFGFEKSLHHFP